MIRLLDREADITTRYGGGFVQSIDGPSRRARRRPLARLVLLRQRDRVAASARADVPSAAATGSGGTTATGPRRCSVPAVVGSWPEPFAAGGRRRGRPRAGARRVPRRAAPPATSVARAPRRRPGVEHRRPRAPETARACGSWSGPGRGCAPTRVAAQLDDGPATSGVFARFERGRRRLAADRARPDGPTRPRRSAAGAGLVAAMRRGDEPADLDRHRHRRRRRRARRRRCSTPTRCATATRVAHRRRRRSPLPDGEAG